MSRLPCANAFDVPPRARWIHLSSITDLVEALLPWWRCDSISIASGELRFSGAAAAGWVARLLYTPLRWRRSPCGTNQPFTWRPLVLWQLQWWPCSSTRLYPPQRLLRRPEAASAALMLPDIQPTGTSGWAPCWGQRPTSGAGIP